MKKRLIYPLLCFVLLAGAVSCQKTPKPQAAPLHEQVTGEEGPSSPEAWDRMFDTPVYLYGKDPIPFLAKHMAKFPKQGAALVLAMGEGQNAVALAQYGMKVEGVDISEVALRKARRLAKEKHVEIRTIAKSMRDYDLGVIKWDVIVNTIYFRREMIPAIKAALKPGGYVLFENYLEEHIKNPSGLNQPQRFYVKRGELKELFSDFEILEARDSNDGKNALSQLLARKRLK